MKHLRFGAAAPAFDDSLTCRVEDRPTSSVNLPRSAGCNRVGSARGSGRFPAGSIFSLTFQSLERVSTREGGGLWSGHCPLASPSPESRARSRVSLTPHRRTPTRAQAYTFAPLPG